MKKKMMPGGAASVGKAKSKSPHKGAAAPAGEGSAEIATIEHLIRLMGEHGLVEIEVRSGKDRKIRLSKRASEPTSVVYAPAPAASAAPAAGARGAPAAAAEVPAAKAVDPNLVEFTSPMVGTFYRAPSPESPPYVTNGDKVAPETVLCIIEAMKVLNEIKAEQKGEVVDILVENGEAVEYGQPLFLIRKSG